MFNLCMHEHEVLKFCIGCACELLVKRKPSLIVKALNLIRFRGWAIKIIWSFNRLQIELLIERINHSATWRIHNVNGLQNGG